MSDNAAGASQRGSFNAGFESRGGPRGRRPRREDKTAWVPSTKLGRLVKDRRIRTLEDIFLFSLPIKEAQIVDFILGEKTLKDELMKITPVQKQTTAGQRTRFKAWVIVGDQDGHVGLGVKCAKEAGGAIKGALVDAKLNIVPVRRGYWGSRAGSAHTVPCKVAGKCGSVRFRIVPAPRGTGIVAAIAAKKLLTLAGIQDCYTTSRGSTRTLGNFVFAVYYAVRRTYTYLTPEFWHKTSVPPTPYQEHSSHLKDKKNKLH